MSRAWRSCRAAGRGAEGRDTAREQRHRSRIGRLALERWEASTPGGQMTGRQGGERTEGGALWGAARRICPEPTRLDACRASTLSGSSSSAMVSLDSRIRSDQCAEGWARAGTKIVGRIL